MPDGHVDRTNLDDPSAHYGLGHNFSLPAVPRDSKGRRIAELPPVEQLYREDLVDVGPGALAEALAADETDRQRARDERDSNNYEKLMREVPGGKPTSHSSGSSRRPKRPGPRSDHTKQGVVDVATDPRRYRPHCRSGRVSSLAAAGLDSQAVSIGDMLDALGETLAVGVAWTQIETALRDCVARSQVA